jgi:hypothetical protein
MNCLGARENHVQRLVGWGLFDSALHRAAKGAHCADFSPARDRDLTRRQQPFIDFSLRAVEQGLDLAGIEPHLGRMLSEKMLCRHNSSPSAPACDRTAMR